MSDVEDIFHSEENKFFLNNQINAVVRVITLAGSKIQLTLDDVFRRLADAERNAEFFCGFVDLNEKDNKKYRDMLKEYLVFENFVEIDSGGFVTLTDKGNEQAKTPLPIEIENALNLV